MASSSFLVGLPSGSSVQQAFIDQEDQLGSKKLRRCFSLSLPLSLIITTILTIALVHFALVKDANYYSPTAEIDFVTSACTSLTRFPEACIDSLSTTANVVVDSRDLAIVSASVAVEETHGLWRFSASVLAGLGDCEELLERSYEYLALASDAMHDTHRIGDARVWLSAGMTFHRTCIDELSYNTNANITASTVAANIAAMKVRAAHAEKLISNALALAASYAHTERFTMQAPLNSGFRKLVGEFETPTWMKRDDAEALFGLSQTKADVTVALDGSGNFRSIQAAVNAAPQKSSKRYVIYIKAGTYKEMVDIPKSVTFLMFIGDGIGKTIITGNMHQPDVTTFKTATVAVNGNNFLARDITFQNTAGAINNQAVALRVSADQTAFYKCSMDAFQDTLYVHALRQFYRECTVIGTVDFIFGDSASVFQACNILARTPMKGQKNTMTAQGRTDPNAVTGLSFHSCTIDGTADLKNVIAQFPTYLGRPWKEYSRTVFLKCYMSSVVHPEGWLPWDGNFALKTLFYAEYLSNGPGAGAAKRVSWSSQITSVAVANQYTVANFINGKQWLSATSFPFQADL